MILNDMQIRELCNPGRKIGSMPKTVIDARMGRPMISPFREDKIRGAISFGLSSFGYDITLGSDIQLVRPVTDVRDGREQALVLDPKNFRPEFLDPAPGYYDGVLLPPYSFALAASVETFSIPRDVLGICVGKSTYARCGLIVNVTPLEPEWEGVLTLELSNTTPVPVVVYPGEGICQMLFLQGQVCNRSYKDKKGKYQDQTGLTLPKVS